MYEDNEFNAMPEFQADSARQTSGITRGGSKLGRAGLIGILVVLVAFGGLAIRQALLAPAGPSTPEEAVSMLFAALDKEDVLGVAEVMLPSEVDSLLVPATDVVAELVRLDVASDQAVNEVGDVEFFTAYSFDIPAEGEPGELVYEIVPVGGNPDVQWVTVSEGQITASFDPQPILDLMGGRLSEIDEDSLDLPSGPETESVDLAEAYADGEPLEFAVVEEKGFYYVSLYYTVAGLASEGDAPDFAAAPIPNGTDTPEAAVVQFMDELIDLDAEGVLATLDPMEFRAAYDYWDSYSPGLLSGIDEIKGFADEYNVSWDLVSAEASATERNGRTVAMIEEMTFSVKSANPELQADLLIELTQTTAKISGTLDNESLSLEISEERIDGFATFDGQKAEAHLDLETFAGTLSYGTDVVELSRNGDCLTIEFDEEVEELCGEDLNRFSGWSAFDPALSSAMPKPEVTGLTVVEREGKWYISGAPTISYGMVDYLKALEPADLDALIEQWKNLAD